MPETGKNLELLDMLQVPCLPRVSAACRLSIPQSVDAAEAAPAAEAGGAAEAAPDAI